MTTARLPLFPLNTVLFPGLVLPLNVFEERYRAMMRELLTIDDTEPRRFAVVAIRDGREVAPTAPGMPDPTALPEKGPAVEASARTPSRPSTGSAASPTRRASASAPTAASR